jgi:hypothetical protein
MTGAPESSSAYVPAGAAIVSGPTAWVLGRILAAPHVRTLLLNLSAGWLRPYAGEVADAVAAVHRAAAAWDMAASTSPTRSDETALGEIEPPCLWSVSTAAAHLGLTERRVQQLAERLGGRRVGRTWGLDPAAVREYGRRRKAAA